ncbi:MAG: bifunctional oligoribonuclease/PAP phosphatase NrnA [Clostridia bacterium]|nr:bifunctional oligoribonuclease/PAP phosphatase NrnA [Clostridia bacterium]
MYQKLTLTETAARLPAGLPTLILFHRHPDGDAVGAGFGLKLILEAMGCTVCCVCEDEIPERLRFLTEGLQDSILKENLPTDFVPTQIISVDTASPAQAGVLYPDYEGRFDLMIDHHAKGEMYADGYIDGSASSAGELIYRLSRELVMMGRLAAIPEGVDRLLYAAVSSDTGCFRYSNASPETHRAAAALLEAGFDSADLNHRLFGVKSYKLLQAEKVGFDRLKLYADGKLGIVAMPYAVMEQYGFTDEHLGTLVDVARGLQGVQVAVAIRQPKAEGVYRVSMRSSCDVDVAAICAEFGGGGHIKAAGCTVSCEGGMDEVVEAIAKIVEAELCNY